MKKIWVLPLAITALLQMSVNAKTLIISDIDDTIKRTHVKGSKVDGLKLTNQYEGLSYIYNALLCKDLEGDKFEFCVSNQGLGHSEETQLVYVTGAPGSLRSLGREFIQMSDFPVGVVKGRESSRISTKDFKIATIREILNAMPEYNDVVMIGDNGEYDALVYNTIEKEFPTRNITSYIHTVYSVSPFAKEKGAKLYENQKSYLTSADLGLNLLASGLIKESELRKAALVAQKAILSNDEDEIEKVIPEWTVCSYFYKTYEAPSVKIEPSLQVIINTIEKQVKKICK
ncbi:PF09949 family protein [Bacteriovorax sp. BSW11_IV]|uniref:phosphatase domain-containing protein n=1 Tax=Bacteriovorax sp. BSW11_IV TaxID=1353529 RepID=UPI000389EFFB|nr:phosphatase domain-containing protein [Bacteriovorax sp. BSW11_IV]EQC43619.1 PF09949 family protein [Bacteriovorax sp. BSW11_IV]